MVHGHSLPSDAPLPQLPETIGVRLREVHEIIDKSSLSESHARACRAAVEALENIYLIIVHNKTNNIERSGWFTCPAGTTLY